MPPHPTDDVLRLGPVPAATAVTVIAVHGRDQTPEWLVDALIEPLGDPAVAWLAPRAPGQVWYPHPFGEPLADNEPELTESIGRLTALVESTGVPPSSVVLTGFSQGACLVDELVARHPRRWGGLVSYTGGRMGPLGVDLTIHGDLAETPVRLSAGDADPWISPAAIRATAASFEAAGAEVRVHLFAGDADHRIRPREVELLRDVIESVREAP